MGRSPRFVRRAQRCRMSPAYKTWRPPLPPHGSPATDPPCLSSTACRGKISAKRDNSRYQPLTSLAAEVPGQHHQKHRKSKPSHPNHYHPAISLAVRAHNSSCQRHPACPRLSHCTSEQARTRPAIRWPRGRAQKGCTATESTTTASQQPSSYWLSAPAASRLLGEPCTFD